MSQNVDLDTSFNLMTKNGKLFVIISNIIQDTTHNKLIQLVDYHIIIDYYSLGESGLLIYTYFYHFYFHKNFYEQHDFPSKCT